MDLFDDLKKNRAGLLVGAGVGLATVLYLKTTGVDLSFAIASPGVLDNTLAASVGLAELAVTKVGIAFMLLGAFIGYVIDNYWL